ncbi:hypothetical protein PCE1_001514 [Barthelona sp. PCE]
MDPHIYLRISIVQELALTYNTISMTNSIKKSQSRPSITGPLQVQSIAVNALVLFIIFTAEISEWVSNVRYSTAIPYLFAFFVNFCIARIRLYFNPYSSFPLFASLLPFAIITIAAREAHATVALIYFSCVCSIHLQSNDPELKRKISLYIFLTIVVYSSCLLFMDYFYQDTSAMSNDAYKGLPLTEPISWSRSLTIFVCITVLGVLFLNIQSFVQRYVDTISESKQELLRLQKRNAALEDQIQRYVHSEDKVETPMSKVLALLKALKQDAPLSKEHIAIIDYVVTELSLSDRLHNPIISHADNMNDEELSGWLGEMNVLFANKKFESSSPSLNSPTNGGTTLGEPSRNRMTNFAVITRVSRMMSQSEKTEVSYGDLAKNLKEWNFSAHRIDESTQKPLLFVGYAIFLYHDIPSKFGISDTTLRNFLIAIESAYKVENPYHSRVHAADVLQCVHFLLTSCGLERGLTDLEIFALLFSAVIHDVGHPGTTNQFQINKQTHLALVYNDRSVLENHHLSAVFMGVLSDKNMNILSSMPREEQMTFRKHVIDLVLATDMAKHFDILGSFKTRLQGMDEYVFTEEADRLLLTQMIMKVADISNPARPRPIAYRWAQHVMEEFGK